MSSRVIWAGRTDNYRVFCTESTPKTPFLTLRMLELVSAKNFLQLSVIVVKAKAFIFVAENLQNSIHEKYYFTFSDIFLYDRFGSKAGQDQLR